MTELHPTVLGPQATDFSNRRFGTVVALRRHSLGKWECLCDCGKTVLRQSSHLPGIKFCSRGCGVRNREYRTERICPKCGKHFLVLTCKLKQRGYLAKFCSQKCRTVIDPPTVATLSEYYTEDENGCWNWNRRLFSGRATIKVNCKDVMASRYVWALFNEPIPRHLLACHKCDNPRCIRPSHIFIGTTQDNSADMVAKKRHAFGETKYNAKLTEEVVREMRLRHANGEQVNALAIEKQVAGPVAWNAIHRKTWRHVE